MARKLMGGSFAPPIDEAKLATYESLVPSGDRQAADNMTKLLTMLRKFRETPGSQQPSTPHPVVGTIIPLEDDEVQRIWDVVPYREECDVIGQVFERLPVGDVRNAAFHLLWYAYELAADREPITSDYLR